MWFFLALFVAGFILTAFLTPKMKIENAKASGLDDFTFPRSSEGDPVGRFYGTLKLSSPNTIGVSGFKATPIKKKVKTGLFSSKRVITGYRYNATVDLAWALGPGVVYRQMWFGENKVWAGCLYTEDCYNEIVLDLPELYGGSKDGARGGIAGTVGCYCGAFDQSRDPYLVVNVSADVPAYVGVAHMVFRDFWWGNSPNIDTVSVEVAYFTNGLGTFSRIMPNGLDANPIEVLYDIFTSDWGNLGYDPARINTDAWRVIADQIWDEGLGISISVANATEATDVVKQVLRLINGIVYEDQTTGLVEIALIRNDYDIGDLEVLTPSEVVEISNYSKKLWTETNNVVRVKYTDRADDYAAGKIAIAKDSSLLRYQGKERPVEVEMPGVFDAETANVIAARELSNLNVPLYSASMTLSRKASLLKPGQPFILQWPEYGIVQMVMRVRTPKLGTLEDGRISFNIVQDEFSTAATVIAAPVPSEYEDVSFEPVDVATFKLMELPAFLDYKAGLGTLAGNSRLAAFAVAPSAYTLGFDAFIEAGDDDAEVLSISPYSDHALLAAPVERFDGFADGTLPWVTINTLSDVTALEIEGTLRQGGGLVLIDSELLAYEGFSDEGGGVYKLLDVHRAMIDSGWEKHLAGARVYFFNGQEGFFESDTPSGDTIDVYLTDRTTSGSSAVADATLVPFTLEGRIERVIAPDYITVDGTRDLDQVFAVGDTLTLDARARNRLDVTELWLEDDAAGVAEAGTLYDIYYEIGGVETLVDADQTLPYVMTTTLPMAPASVVVHIYAKKDGLLSIASTSIPILVILPESLTIDNLAVTIDSATVEF